MSHIDRIDWINFKTIKLALISFQNDNQDEVFAYYSSKNKRILLSLKMTQQQIKRELKNIKLISKDIEGNYQENVTGKRQRFRTQL